MSGLNRPLRVWHGIAAVVLALVLGACATAIATSSGTARGKTVIGTSHKYSYVKKSFSNRANEVDQGVVDCGKGKVPVGGGALAGANSTSGAQAVNSSYPHDGGDRDEVPDGWAVFMDNRTNGDLKAEVYAVCRKVR